MARSLVHACWLLWLFVATAARLSAAPATPTTTVGPATWPDRGPYEKVGGYDEGLNNVKLPRPVVAAVQRAISDAPSHWNLYDGLHDFAGHNWPILQLYGHTNGYLTLLKARGSWTILSVPAALPMLNEVLDPLIPADLQSIDKTGNYLWHIVLLQRHGQGSLLDKDFQREKLDNPYREWWHQGTEARRRALRALCHDPVVTGTGEHATVQCNFLTVQGAVERWTLRLRLGKSVQLAGTDVRQIRKEGTFFHPI